MNKRLEKIMEFLDPKAMEGFKSMTKVDKKEAYMNLVNAANNEDKWE